MKKFLSLLLVVVLMVPCFAFAESILDADPEEIMTFDRASYVTDWQGEWVLAAAYIGEEFADDNDIEVNGLIAVPENAVKMTVEAVMDLSATGSLDGVMVDMGEYIHAHCYDMIALLEFDDSISDLLGYLRVPWNGWNYEVRGEQDGDFNFGVGKMSKISVPPEPKEDALDVPQAAKDKYDTEYLTQMSKRIKEFDKSLFFGKITGVKNNAIADENMKYVGMNTAGNLIVCYSESNIVTKPESEVAFAFIFVRAE